VVVRWWPVFVIVSFVFKVSKKINKMEGIKSVIRTYQRRLMEMPYVATTSYGRIALGDDGDANKLFLTYLFGDKQVGLQFLKDVGLFAAR
jgi:hypothetical protein